MANLLGYDIGSSSIKAAILEAESGELIASAASPSTELPIKAVKPGWAEQDPALWWEHVVKATSMLARQNASALSKVSAIGISYQMHGLVVLDKNYEVLRPSIIWCDSRAVPIGETAFKNIGEERCLSHLLNSPGNFTASKLRWVRENEPSIYGKIHKFMLPGDYIALKLTGEAVTTPSGLSEGILWDFLEGGKAQLLLDHYQISSDLLPNVLPTFFNQGAVTPAAAKELGIPAGALVTYRAGDQPNNAFSLNVLEPGEFAATAGTSGVVYGVGESPSFDKESRVNTFVHVNHTSAAQRYGTLLCCNGTGILNSWLKREISGGLSYDEMNNRASTIKPSSDGLFVFPYGNGAERSLNNKNIGASIRGLNFNFHGRDHLFRAAQEGIVFSLQYGLEIMREMKIPVKTVRAGRANLFLSPLFRSVFAAVTGAAVELYDTDGAQGAARGAGIGAAIYKSPKEAFTTVRRLERVEPDRALASQYKDIYGEWSKALRENLSG